MGLESYLISLSFKKPIEIADLVDVFQDCGAKFLNNKSNTEQLESFRHWYFEIRSDLGLTEIDVLLTPFQVVATTCSIRFSILSPSTVIDQTFNFLSILKSKRSIKIFDTENNSRELKLDIESFKLNKNNIKKRQIIINNDTGLIIEGGNATTKYIHDNNLLEKIWRLKK